MDRQRFTDAHSLHQRGFSAPADAISKSVYQSWPQRYVYVVYFNADGHTTSHHPNVLPMEYPDDGSRLCHYPDILASSMATVGHTHHSSTSYGYNEGYPPFPPHVVHMCRNSLDIDKQHPIAHCFHYSTRRYRGDTLFKYNETATCTYL